MKFLHHYINSFNGLNRSIWYLSIVTLINRAGTMVIPFLSIYMQEELSFTKSQIGWILAIFGLGSLAGSWIGGKLSDRFGFYPIMVLSMFGTGIGFVLLQFLHTFEALCIGIFLLLIIADSFRPASFSAIISYSKPKDKTRSITLIRLAINLGFMAGPAVAGLIIVAQGYTLLFWIDGLTFLVAAGMIVALLHPEKNKLASNETEVVTPTKKDESVISNSALKDKIYLQFLFVVFLIGFIFMQLFSTIPLYFKESLGYNEALIGRIMLLNGVIIVLFEMPLVSWFEKKRMSKLKVIQFATLLMALSYFVLPIHATILIVIFSTILVSVGEMLGFPFTNGLAMDKAPENKAGEYLGLYTMAFSLSHIVGPAVGMQVAEKFGFDAVWFLMGIIGLLAITLIERLKRTIKARDLKMATT